MQKRRVWIIACAVALVILAAVLIWKMPGASSQTQDMTDEEICQEVLKRYWTTDFEGRFTAFQPIMESGDAKAIEKAYSAYYDSLRNLITDECLNAWTLSREPYKYERSAMDRGYRITPGAMSFAVYQTYDDAVTYSFTMELSAEDAEGTTTQTTVNGQIQIIISQKRVSKITYDKFELPIG